MNDDLHPFDELLGRFATMRAAGFTPQGGVLLTREGAAEGAPTLLLPARERPAELAEGDALDVFVYLDSEDRPVATLGDPKVALGEVAFLEVTELTHFGAFCDNGLPKDLLVPRAEQTRDLEVGDRHPIGMFVDDTGRLAGTMRVTEMLEIGGDFSVGEWVESEVWRYDPEVGVFAIVERRCVGLVPLHEPQNLRRGEHVKMRVTRVFDDGKIELSPRAPAFEARAGDAERILTALRGRTPPRLGDHSDPEDVREAFGLSKKAFKRAVGGLLKSGDVVLDENGFVVLAPAATNKR